MNMNAKVTKDAPRNDPAPRRTRGALIAIGGAEDKTNTLGILRRVLALSNKPDPVVGVITTASSIPDDVFAAYHMAFNTIGASEVLDVRVRDRRCANAPEVIEMMNEDLDWTWALGEAVLEDQAAVLDAAQRFR